MFRTLSNVANALRHNRNDEWFAVMFTSLVSGFILSIVWQVLSLVVDPELAKYADMILVALKTAIACFCMSILVRKAAVYVPGRIHNIETFCLFAIITVGVGRVAMDYFNILLH